MHLGGPVVPWHGPRCFQICSCWMGALCLPSAWVFIGALGVPVGSWNWPKYHGSFQKEISIHIYYIFIIYSSYYILYIFHYLYSYIFRYPSTSSWSNIYLHHLLIYVYIYLYRLHHLHISSTSSTYLYFVYIRQTVQIHYIYLNQGSHHYPVEVGAKWNVVPFWVPRVPGSSPYDWPGKYPMIDHGLTMFDQHCIRWFEGFLQQPHI